MFGLYSNSRVPISSFTNVILTASIFENSVLADPIAIGIGVEDSITESFSCADNGSTISAQFATSFVANQTIEDAAFHTGELLFFITEPFDIADNSSQISEFLFAPVENFTPEDTPTAVANYLKPYSEGTTLTSVESVSAQFINSISEPTTVVSIQNIKADFSSPRVETLTVTSNQFYFTYPVSAGWEPIITDIYAPSGTVGVMLGGAAFGVISFSGFIGETVVVTPGWKDIINN